MRNYNILLQKIKTKKTKVGIIGLGYVGLPLAIIFAKKGFQVSGFVRSRKKVEDLEKGINYLQDASIDKDLKNVTKKKQLIATLIDDSELERQDVLIICVPTPVTEKKDPDLEPFKAVARRLASVDLTGKLIINESTVSPFMTREIIGVLPGDYFLAVSPERVDPGNKKRNTGNIPKVIGGIDKESLLLASTLYKLVLEDGIVVVKNLEIAEMAKMLENTYRAVNIALINEFARLADVCNIDILDVIKAAKTKWSFHAHYPGIGVGGHCIPVDPYYILELAQNRGVSMDVTRLGLKENEKMPEYVLEKMLKHYKKGMSVLVYGITYKKNVNDLRESPATHFCTLLKKKEIPFTVYDPLIPKKEIEELGFTTGSLKNVEILVVGTDHLALEKDFNEMITKDTIVIDGRNYFSTKKGKIVLGVGRTLK